jgi:glycosyltransferase involved in cell wall biosynthesis
VTRFRIVVPVRDAEAWVAKCLASIRSQDAADFRCVVLDDHSSDATLARARAAAAGDERFEVVAVPERRYALENIADGIRRIATDPWDVVVTVDGDDWLPDRRVLSRLARVYESGDAWITYGSFQRWRGRLLERLGLRTKRGLAKPYPRDVVERRSFRASIWRASHLRTFRRFLWDAIRPADLRDPEGRPWRVAWDVAFMFPMLEMAAPDHVVHVHDIVYVYNDTNPASDHRNASEDQILTEARLRLMPRYPPLVAPPRSAR